MSAWRAQARSVISNLPTSIALALESIFWGQPGSAELRQNPRYVLKEALKREVIPGSDVAGGCYSRRFRRMGEQVLYGILKLLYGARSD